MVADSGVRKRGRMEKWKNGRLEEWKPDSYLDYRGEEWKRGKT
jgi:hypothetical protein